MLRRGKNSCNCCDCHSNDIISSKSGHGTRKCPQSNKLTLCLVIFSLSALLTTIAVPVSSSSSSPSLFTSLSHSSSTSGRSIVRRPRYHPSISKPSVNESSTASKIVPVVETSSELNVPAPLVASGRSLSPTTQPLSSSSSGIHRCTGHWRYPSGCKGSSCQYLALWKYNYERDQVDFQVSTNRPDKWVGIGFSKDTKMPGSDAIIAWVEPGSRYVMMDAWLDSYGTPIADVKQSISNISAAAANGLISFFFSRPTNTGDTVHDVNLDDCFHLIFPVNGGSVDIKNRSVMKHEKTPTVTPQKFCLSSCHAKKLPGTTASPPTTTTTTTPTQSTATRLNGNSQVKSEISDKSNGNALSPQGDDKNINVASGESSSSSSATSVTGVSPPTGKSPAVTNLQDNERDSETQKVKNQQKSSDHISISNGSPVNTSISTSVTSSNGNKDHSIEDETSPIYKAPSSTTVSLNNLPDSSSGSSNGNKNEDEVNSSQSVSASVTNSNEPLSNSKVKSVTSSEVNNKIVTPIDSTGDGESDTLGDESAITSCKGEWKYPSRCTGYGCDYKATWEYLDQEDEIKFTISTKNKNKWTGIAFSSDRSMPSTDAIIGLVEDSGRFFLMDTWLRAYAAPSLDPIQNIQNMSVSRENGVTSLRFHRKRRTGDKNDFQFSDTNCPYFLFPVQGGVFNAVNKRLRKHESVPIVSSRRICIKSCVSSKISTTVSVSSVTNLLDSDKVSTSTVPSVSTSAPVITVTSATATATTSNKSSVTSSIADAESKPSHDSGSKQGTTSTTSISSSTSSSSSSTSTSTSSSSSSSSGPSGINLKDWNFSQLGPSVVDLSKLSASSNIPGMKSIPDLTSLLNQMNVSSGGNLPSILRTLANKLPPSNNDSNDTNQSSTSKSNSLLPTFTSPSSDTHHQQQQQNVVIISTSPTISSNDLLSSSSTMPSVSSSTPTRVVESTASTVTSISTSSTGSTGTTKSPGSYRKVTPKVNGKIPDRWTTLRTTTSTSTMPSISADDETDGDVDGMDDDEDDELISTKGKKKISNLIPDSNIKIHESKYEVELKLPKAWKASYARRQSEEFVTFKEKIEQQLKQELSGQFSSLDVQVMEMTGVQETQANINKGSINRQSSSSSSSSSTTSATTATVNGQSSDVTSPVVSNGGENSLIAKVRLSVKSTVPLIKSPSGVNKSSSGDQVPTREVKESSKTANTVTSSSSSSTSPNDLTPVKITEALNSAIRDGRIGDVAVDSNYLIVRSLESGASDAGERYLTDEQLKWTVIISGVAALVALVLMQAGFMIWRDKKNKSSFTSNSGKDSSASLGAHHSYHGYNLSHPNLHGHLYDDIHRSQMVNGVSTRGKKDIRSTMTCDRDYLGDHHYYHGHHLTQSELNHPSSHHHGHQVSSNHQHNHHTSHHHNHASASHNNVRNHNNNSSSGGGGNSSGGSSSSNAQLDQGRHTSTTRHPQSHKLSSLNAMQPDFYFLRHQRRYSGNLVRVFVNYNNAEQG